MMKVAYLALLGMVAGGLGKTACSKCRLDTMRYHREYSIMTEELRRTLSLYRTASDLSFDIDHEVFANYTSNDPIEAQRGNVRRSGKCLYNDNFGSITVLLDTLLVQIDTEDHLMIVSRVLDALPEDVISDDQQLASLLEDCDSISYKDMAGGLRSYRLSYADTAEYECVKILLNRKTGFIQKCILYLARDPNVDESLRALRVEIRYSNLSVSRKDSAIFTESTYFNRVGKRLECAGKYHDYRLADMRKGGAE